MDKKLTGENLKIATCAAISTNVLWGIINKLKILGVRDILVLPIEKVAA